MLNFANRQVCDIDIRDYKTGAPFIFFPNGNTSTVGLTANSVFANKRGVKCIAFQDPSDATLSVTAQVYPFQMLALFADGVISSEATYAVHKEVECETAGELSLADVDASAGDVYVFAKGDFGGTAIEGTYANSKFTATTAADLVVDTVYEVGYYVTKNTGINAIHFNDVDDMKTFSISAYTVDKTEEGDLVPFVIRAYKAAPQKDFEISFASSGDPQEITWTFDLLSDSDGNIMDMVQDVSSI